MSGWISFGGTASYENTSTNGNANQSQYGTRTPTLSTDWTTAFGNLSKNLNSTGADANQQTGLDYLKSLFSGNTQVDNYTPTINSQLANAGTSLNNVGNNLAGFGNYLAGSGAPQSAGTPLVTPQTGAAFMKPYQNDYTNNVVDTTLANYDRHAGDQLNALRAGRDAGSAFGDRANLGDQTYMADSDMNRAQTEAQLRNLGFTNAAGLGQTDASRALAGDTTNASNILGNNQFNANAKIQSNSQALDALNSQSKNILSAAGLSQQVLSNIVTAQGINTDAAQALFAAGSITQSQLNDILNAASAGNGSSFTQNTETTAKSDTTKAGGTVKAGVGV